MASQCRACDIEAEELNTDIPRVISSETPASPHILENRSYDNQEEQLTPVDSPVCGLESAQPTHVWKKRKDSMISYCVRYGDFDKDHMDYTRSN